MSEKAKMEKAKSKKGGAARLALFSFLAFAVSAGALAAAGGEGIITVTGTDYTYFWLALLIPIAIVAISYMASYAFNAPQLRAILQDELLQILATGAIALTLVGTQAVVDGYVAATLHASGASGTGIASAMDAAAAKISELEGQASHTLSGMEDVTNALGTEASRSVYCNFMGVGFSLNNCSPLNAYRGSLTAAAFTTTVALSDTYAQGFLLSLARAYAFSILIPLGLILRCFKASRMAGGALIAVGFGFYTVYPVVILATDNLLHGDQSVAPMPSASHIPLVGQCDPQEPKVDNARSDFVSYGEQLTSYSLIYGISYQMLVRILFMSVLNLIITLGFIRTFAHMIGSDIDVSSLARIS
ncbi:MAG: hypothetical protein WC263_04105 [Candidatus Micrarchaeia archaeon]|jgi:hypothetical protein